ncbi:MAG TPA: hypothetical protein VIR27_08560 [Mycobacteriales bacterium]
MTGSVREADMSVPTGTGTGTDPDLDPDMAPGPDHTATVPTEVSPGQELVVVRPDSGEPRPQDDYRRLFARIDVAHARLAAAQDRLAAAQAELAEAEAMSAQVEDRVHELWWQLRGRLGRRGRDLGALPPADPEAPAGINVDGLLNEAAAEVAGDGVDQPSHRMPHVMIMPVSGGTFGALGYLLARGWLHLVGLNLVGVLGLLGLGFGPLVGVVVGLRWRAHQSGGPVETEPGPALVGFAVAAVAEVALYLTTG